MFQVLRWFFSESDLLKVSSSGQMTEDKKFESWILTIFCILRKIKFLWLFIRVLRLKGKVNLTFSLSRNFFFKDNFSPLKVNIFWHFFASTKTKYFAKYCTAFFWDPVRFAPSKCESLSSFFLQRATRANCCRRSFVSDGSESHLLQRARRAICSFVFDIKRGKAWGKSWGKERMWSKSLLKRANLLFT